MRHLSKYYKLGLLGMLALALIAIFIVLKPEQSSVTKIIQGQIKSAHFVDSTPLHDEIYAAQPINVTINFDFDLAEGSKITVTNAEGQDFSEGLVLVEDNSTALKKVLKPGMPDGDYTIRYSACWFDKSCHDGQFMFKLDASLQATYKDMRGKTEITMDMENNAFAEKNILISPGTKVTWVNQDGAIHFVNTESHPEHTYFPEQNSRQLKKGDTYSTTFTTPGQYNYHCSAHASTMTASLIVAEN